MGLLKKLKSVFGSGSDEQSGPSGDAEVTVEYAPDAESEHAVKGTDEADVAVESGANEPPEADATETDESKAETETRPEEDGETPANPPVGELKGIGPTYSGRLGEAGIETVADLADADPEAVAEAAEVSTSRAEDWIERARSRA